MSGVIAWLIRWFRAARCVRIYGLHDIEASHAGIRCPRCGTWFLRDHWRLPE